MNARKGAAPLVIVLYLAIAGTVGWIGVEASRVLHPATHKKEISAADTQAQQVAKDAAEAQAKLLADVAANKAALSAQQKELDAVKLVAQDAAGFVSGAATALAGENSPSVGVKVAAILVDDAGNTLPPATAAQVKAYQLIVAEMKADNARLSAALLQKEKEAEDAKAAVAKSATAARLATEQAALSDSQAKLAADTVTREAAQHALTVRKLDGEVSEGISFLGRLKAFGIGGSLVLFVLLPLLALAFPELVPFFRMCSAPLLKFWHMVHDREKAFVTRLHAQATQSLDAAHAKLAAEMSAHAETKAMLVKIATTPDAPLKPAQ